MLRFDNRSLTKTFGEPAVIKRQRPGSRNDVGEFVPGEVERFDVMLTSVPMRTFETRLTDGFLRDMEAEGIRLEQARKFFIPSEDGESPVAPVRTKSDSTDPDVIEYKNVDYHVLAIIDYSDGGFAEVLAVRQDDA